ncbi:MAG: M56 family metallopeptidase [Ferruginibacter sp.]
MEQFAYSFTITMLHSTWQMTLLLLVYFAATSIPGKWQPLAKRNLLLVLLAAQLFLSVTSFYFIYSAPFFDYREELQNVLQALGSSQSWLQQYSSWLFAAYAFAVMYKMASTTVSWMQFKKKYTTDLIKASAEIRIFTGNAAQQFGIRKKVQIWYSTHIKSPLVFGFLKPVILLPLAMVNHLSVQQTEALIIHELTHIRQRDYLYNWLLLFMEAVYFFNPFVKIAIRYIRIEREKNCDRQVLQFNYPSIGYAEALLLIARQQLETVQVPVAAVGKNNELFNRIRYFSAPDTTTKNTFKSYPFIALILGAIIGLNMITTGFHLQKNTATAHTRIMLKESLYAQHDAVAGEYDKIITNTAFHPVIVPDEIQQPDQAETTGTDIPAAETAKAVAAKDVDKTLEEENINDEPVAFASSSPMVTNVSLSTEAAPIIIKEVTINEQNSNGVTVTKTFRVTQTVNGEWKVEPLWMSTEQPLTDSLKLQIRKDSTVIRIIPTVQ